MCKFNTRKTFNTLPVIEAANEVERDNFASLLKLFPASHKGAQTVRLFHALKNGPITSHDARKHLAIYDVDARIIELRSLGFSIDSHLVSQQVESGMARKRVSLYILNGKVQHE